MISFKLNRLHEIDKKHGLSQKELHSLDDKIPEYLEKIHKRDQGFYKVIDDESVIEEIEQYAAEVQGKYDTIVLLGIGGSSLGSICLKRALMHLFMRKPTSPHLYIMDNIGPTFIGELMDKIDLKKTLFLVITKSGGTPETVTQYFYFRDKIEKAKLPVKDHFVFVTDPEKGLLRKTAKEEGIKAFDIPQNVGGRFSVLTAVGLLPAALIDINIRALIRGAQRMRDFFLSTEFETNLSFQLAVIQYLLDKKGKNITVMMPYSQKLLKLSEWYKQLLAESIGKKLDNNGNEVFTGITPVNALGTTDQHSQSQLYNEGPNDKLVIFLEVNDYGISVPIPNLKPDDPDFNYINGLTFEKLIKTEKDGTEGALTKNNRPNMTIVLDAVSEVSMGELFMLFEGSIAFLGEMYNINAFDQPGVELSKIITKELLSK